MALIKKVKDEEIEENTSLTKLGTDYGTYQMSAKERIVGGLIGFVLGFAMMEVFFMVNILSVIVGVIAAVLGQPLFNKYLFNKRAESMRVQFRDFLEALSSAYSAGKTALGGFSEARETMDSIYGEDCEFSKELRIILGGLESGYKLSELLEDFSKRAHMDGLTNFVDTFNICQELGGDVRNVVQDTKQMITDQMTIEMEIQTKITENRSSINIIAIMPFIMVMMLRATGNSMIVDNTTTNVVVKLICLAIFVGSYLLGRKIMDIRF